MDLLPIHAIIHLEMMIYQRGQLINGYLSNQMDFDGNSHLYTINNQQQQQNEKKKPKHI